MAPTREEIKVGAVVVVAGALFLSALVLVGGVNLLGRKRVTYTTYFKFAGGLEPGAFVRFAGLKVGSVQAAGLDPGDSTRIRMTLLVDEKTPVRTDSKARISSLGFLGENYVEVSPGNRESPRLSPGGEIAALEIVQLADVFNNANNITVNANKLVNDLDDRLLVLANDANQLVSNLNEVVRPENRQHVDAALVNVDAILAETRPRLQKSLANIETASARLEPTIENANATITRANTLAGNLNTVVEENRAEVHEVLVRLRESLLDARRLIADLDDTVDTNRGNLNEVLENIRVSSQNLKQFTDTLKRRPFSLVRIKAEKDRVRSNGK
jgi:phospholipid/cholesterol/gamma-HCH transport system substrate-binding protein